MNVAVRLGGGRLDDGVLQSALAEHARLRVSGCQGDFVFDCALLPHLEGCCRVLLLGRLDLRQRLGLLEMRLRRVLRLRRKPDESNFDYNT